MTLLRRNRKWSEMSTAERVGAAALGTIQVTMAVVAWLDLAKRSADQVNGPKGLWAAIIGVNVVGPIAYFVKGRKRAA